jgi:hypothetical protein
MQHETAPAASAAGSGEVEGAVAVTEATIPTTQEGFCEAVAVMVMDDVS